MFNCCAAALKLGMSGYYQAAFSLVRDLYETVQLLDYLGSEPDQIALWEASDRKTRMKNFAPRSIRDALDKRDGFKEQKRKFKYDQLSEYASHATAVGFTLVAPEGLGKLGPFLSGKYLKALIEELVKYAVHGAAIFDDFFNDLQGDLSKEKIAFSAHVRNWSSIYFNNGQRDAT